MNLSVLVCGKDVFANCECIHGYAFKTAQPWDKCAVFDAFHSLKSAIAAHLGVYSAHFSHARNCFECLSPHNAAT